MERLYKEKPDSYLIETYKSVVLECRARHVKLDIEQDIIDEMARRWYEEKTGAQNEPDELETSDTVWFVDHSEKAITKVLIRSKVYYSTDGKHRRNCSGFIIEFPNTKRQKALPSWSVGYNLFRHEEDARKELGL